MNEMLMAFLAIHIPVAVLCFPFGFYGALGDRDALKLHVTWLLCRYQKLPALIVLTVIKEKNKHYE